MLWEHANTTVKFKTELNLAASSRLKLPPSQKWIWAPVVTSRKHEPLLRLGIENKAKIWAGNVIVIGEAKQQKFNPGKWKGKSVSENPCVCGSSLAEHSLARSHALHRSISKGKLKGSWSYWPDWTVRGDPLRIYCFNIISLKTLTDLILPKTATEANLAMNSQVKMQDPSYELLPWRLKAHMAEEHEDMNLALISVPPRLTTWWLLNNCG